MNQPLNFTQEEIETLLTMQDELNSYIHPQWKKQEFDWHFAIVDEVCEIREHLGWKWWKENYQVGLTEGNRKQVQLEVIDILHFILSIASERDYSPGRIIQWMERTYYGKQELLSLCDDILLEVVQDTADIYEIWKAMAVATGLTKEAVLETYIQKFVLNKFRQDHGYKDGSYCKTWDVVINGAGWNLEDNEALSYIVDNAKQLKVEVTDQSALYTYLERMYNSRLNQ